MKKIVISATIVIVTLLGTAFAVVGNNDSGILDSDVLNPSPITLSGTTTTFVSKVKADVLISELNHEYKRIEANNSFEDVDLLTERAIDIVLSTMELRNTEGLSEMEVDQYVKSRFELIDIFDKYTQTLPKGDRKELFMNAVSYMRELMTFD